MKISEKKRLLIEYIELLCRYGYNIEHLICKPLAYFDFDKVKNAINEFREKHDTY
jgi:hypothetical protein